MRISPSRDRAALSCSLPSCSRAWESQLPRTNPGRNRHGTWRPLCRKETGRQLTCFKPKHFPRCARLSISNTSILQLLGKTRLDTRDLPHFSWCKLKQWAAYSLPIWKKSSATSRAGPWGPRNWVGVFERAARLSCVNQQIQKDLFQYFILNPRGKHHRHLPTPQMAAAGWPGRQRRSWPGRPREEASPSPVLWCSAHSARPPVSHLQALAAELLNTSTSLQHHC